MAKKKSQKRSPVKEHKVDPNSFYRKPEGIYDLPKNKTKLNVIDKVDELPRIPEKVITGEQPIPKPFDQEKYKKKANDNLEDMGAGVRVYNKSSVNLLIAILIGVMIVFGLFFVWSVSNDKFKTDFDCPDCKCEQADLSCPAPAKIPDCVCSQNFTCASPNNTKIIDAINNITIRFINSSS